MAHIGIVACSAEGAALCYRTICQEAPALLGAYAHPQISLNGASFAEYVARLDRGDWNGVGRLMLGSAEKLAAAGADFFICPDNTVHAALPFIEARLPRPFLHIADAVAALAVERRYGTLGIMGTRWLVESEVYPRKLREFGIVAVRPSEADRAETHRIIMDELVAGVFRPDSTARLQETVAHLGDAGCDAVVLGCTELPIVLSGTHAPIPLLDSTRLLARAALVRATAE